jgi:hypothetical protein
LPKVPGGAAQRWLDARQADLLPVDYYHVVFTCRRPSPTSPTRTRRDLRLLFDTAAETLLTIAADPKHLGARIGATLVLHTWGSALTHHPHVHGIVPGGGLAPDGKPGSPVGRVLPAGAGALSAVPAALPRRASTVASRGRLQFFGEHAALADARAFAAWLAPLRKDRSGWSTPSARSQAPQAVLAYLSRYTHRVAISNSRLVAVDERGVTFRWKDYRAKGRTRHKTMTLEPPEFMRRFLLHVLPGGFHRIRHYGLLANGNRSRSVRHRRRPGHHDDAAAQTTFDPSFYRADERKSVPRVR